MTAASRRLEGMTVEERLDRIEAALAGWADAQRGLAAEHTQADSITQLVQTIEKYVASADARVARIEDHLETLIRAISAEHGAAKAEPLSFSSFTRDH